MLPALIAHLLIDLANLIIGVYVLSRSPRGIVHRSFFLFVLGIVSWSMSIVLLCATGLAWLTTIPFLCAELMVLGFVLLAEVFPDGGKISKRYLFYFLPWLAVVLITPSGLVVRAAHLSGGHLEAQYGPLIPLFGIVMGAYLLWGIGKLISKYHRLRGIRRIQMRYLAIGAGIFLFFAFLTNVVLPSIHVSSFNLMGPLFSVVFVGMTAYAIVRHQFLDIRFVIQRSFFYVFSIGIITCIFFGVDLVIRKFTQSEGWGDDVVSAIIGAFGFVRFRHFFERITNPIFFRKEYRYASAVHELGPLLHSTIDLETLLLALDSFLAQTIRPERTIFVVGAADKEHFVRSFLHGAPGSVSRKGYEDAIMAFAAGAHEPIFLQEQAGPVATMLLGKKLSDDIFRLKDIELLSVIAHQAGLAIENAQLYKASERYGEELEDRVRERTAELRKMQEVQSKFVTDISHELQTPVAVLKANMEILEGRRAGNRKVAFGVVGKTVERMAQMVDHLLAIARLNFSKEKLHKQEILVEDLLEEAYGDCSILAENAGVALSYASDAVPLFADKEKLKAVILNLLSNALKHTPRGRKIMLLGKRAGGKTEIIVEDTGSGIAPEDMPHIFERFYRMSGDRSSGTGLGLDICKKIVEMHSGTIIVESVIGKGSKFTVSLPVGPLDVHKT